MWSSTNEHSIYFSENEIQFRIVRTVWDTVGEGKCIGEKKPFLKSIEYKTWKLRDRPAFPIGRASLAVCVGQLLVLLSSLLVDVPFANKWSFWDVKLCTVYCVFKGPVSALVLVFSLLWVTFWGQMLSVMGDAQEEIRKAVHPLIFSCFYFSLKT